MSYQFRSACEKGRCSLTLGDKCCQADNEDEDKQRRVRTPNSWHAGNGRRPLPLDCNVDVDLARISLIVFVQNAQPIVNYAHHQLPFTPMRIASQGGVLSGERTGLLMLPGITTTLGIGCDHDAPDRPRYQHHLDVEQPPSAPTNNLTVPFNYACATERKHCLSAAPECWSPV
jgi:hypothetical protein